MKKALLIISLLVVIIYSCNQNDKRRQTLLTTSELTSQFFSIDASRDTTLYTEKGALIHIPNGALTAKGKSKVQLEVKEAYNISDILLAGLTTQSNGRPLSSGGMIYINVAGEKATTFNKPLSVATPSDFLQKDMQLYKGEVNEDSSINWADTTPLQENKQLLAIRRGEALFKENCSSCHALDKVLTGPALGFIHENRDESGIQDAFIYNSAKVLASGNLYYNCLFRQYNKTVMPAFPGLIDSALDDLYMYIQNESRLLFPNHVATGEKPWDCLDSCEAYEKAVGPLYEKRQKLIYDNDDLLVRDTNNASGIRGLINTRMDSCTNCPPDKVIPRKFKSVYYQFTIEVGGWYNIDVELLNMDNIMEAVLKVKIPEVNTINFQVFLVIPSVKVFQEGGQLQTADDEFGFYNKNGKTPLPPNTKAIVFAFGENPEDDELVFAEKTFITQPEQELELTFKKVSKKQFREAVQAMTLDSVALKVKDSKNATRIRKIDKKIKALDRLKPKNCDCNCGVDK